jgi:hypothetical protein
MSFNHLTFIIMDNFIQQVLDYLLVVITNTGLQLFVLFAPLLILAFLMNLVSSRIKIWGPALMGDKTFIYSFKWIGTPLHELGHALFAFLFGHTITKVKLFDPDAEDGSYGYVAHSYEPGNVFHEIGKLFIGIGPILMCTIMLYISTYVLFGFSVLDISSGNINSGSFTHLSSLKHMGIIMAQGFGDFWYTILHGSNSSWWKILIFIYLLFSIGSSITLSTPDIQGASSGFFFIVVLLFIFNILTSWIGDFAVKAMDAFSSYFSGFYFIMVLALITNLFFALLIFSLKLLKEPLRQKYRGY